MKRASVLLRPVLLAAGALAGLFGAHALDYWLLISDPVRRQALLHATGHAWIPQIESVAVACALAAVVGALLSGTRPLGGRPAGFGRSAVVLAVAQSLGFVMLEVGERIFVGAPLHHLTPLLLAVGVGLQLLTAVAVAPVLWLLVRAGARLARALRGTHPRTRAPRPVTLASQTAGRARSPLRSLADPVRGPPALAAS